MVNLPVAMQEVDLMVRKCQRKENNKLKNKKEEDQLVIQIKSVQMNKKFPKKKLKKNMLKNKN